MYEWELHVNSFQVIYQAHISNSYANDCEFIRLVEDPDVNLITDYHVKAA